MDDLVEKLTKIRDIAANDLRILACLSTGLNKSAENVTFGLTEAIGSAKRFFKYKEECQAGPPNRTGE